ncbi:MAG TPA: endonuclease [bacterium]|nr:endonuclease [bacterium]
MKKKDKSTKILDKIFFSKFKKGVEKVEFERTEITDVCKKMKLSPPKNLGSLIYGFRYRDKSARKIRATAPSGKFWVLLGAGKGRYAFVLRDLSYIIPKEGLEIIEIADSTPGLVQTYALNDEQALLAKLRYNRIIDIFTGVTCFSLQNHMRTQLPGVGQVETDEIYVGVDGNGQKHFFPVQAKGGADKLNIAQIDQDFGVGGHKFPDLYCRPIAAQFMDDNVIAIFEFAKGEARISIRNEKHYKLVPASKDQKGHS